uniref:Uncharacterized protein n=1 Tax=Salvator merianae TaxID=96440 RepID=A0A8D0DMX7_SALMN
QIRPLSLVVFPQNQHPTPYLAARQPFKLSIPESPNQIKGDSQFLQMASEKTEIWRFSSLKSIRSIIVPDKEIGRGS